MPRHYVTATAAMHTSKTAYTIDSARSSLWSSSFQPIPDDRMMREAKPVRPGPKIKARTGRAMKSHKR